MKNLNLCGRAAVLLLAALTGARASTVFYSGDLRTNANIIDCGSGCTLTPANDDATWAQWAAYSVPFTVSSPSLMNAITFSFGGGTSATGPVVPAGGLEPYLSLFDAAGNFLASTYLIGTCPAGAIYAGGNCFDVQLDGGLLPVGNYTLVLSAYANMSFAENNGTGTLADGFTGLGNLGQNENLNFAFDLNLTDTAPTPEPGTAALLAAAGGAFALRQVLRRRRS